MLPDDFRLEKGHFLESDATFRQMFASERARIASAIELLDQMDRAGVTHSVIAGYGWTSPEVARISNDYLLESAASSDGRLIPLCSVNPLWGADAIREIERCRNAGARGIGEIHPDSQNLMNSDFAGLAGFFDAAAEMRLPVLVHASEPVGHSYPGKGTVTPEYSVALAQAFPKNVIVLAHFGGGLPFYSLMPGVRDALKNVYFDSAAFPFLYEPQVFDAAVAAAGSGRILFASDFPVVSQERALAEFQTSGIGQAHRADILSGNAARVWSIE